jgi:hypothetical protein
MTNSAQRGWQIAGLIVGLAIGSLGAISLYRDYQVTALILDSRHWVTGEAVIYDSELHEKWSSGRHGGDKYFWLTVVYHFKVADVDYTGDRFEITYVHPNGDEEHLRQLLANYKPRSMVEILYDPKDPTRSVVLRPELDYGDLVFPGAFDLSYCFLPFIYVFANARKMLVA